MRKNSCLTLGLIVAGCGYSGVAGAETLQEALASAYLTNPTLESQRSHLKAVDEQVPQALANWRPTVKLSGDAMKTNTLARAPTATV